MSQDHLPNGWTCIKYSSSLCGYYHPLLQVFTWEKPSIIEPENLFLNGHIQTGIQITQQRSGIKENSINHSLNISTTSKPPLKSPKLFQTKSVESFSLQSSEQQELPKHQELQRHQEPQQQSSSSDQNTIEEDPNESKQFLLKNYSKYFENNEINNYGLANLYHHLKDEILQFKSNPSTLNRYIIKFIVNRRTLYRIVISLPKRIREQNLPKNEQEAFIKELTSSKYLSTIFDEKSFEQIIQEIYEMAM
ncbi:hypothetical protein QTN25_009958 [Entamoeba marina]